MTTTNIIVFIACLSAYVGVCWLLFVKVWPERRKQPKRVVEPFRWPNSVFETKKRKD